MKTYYITLERSKERATYIQNHVEELQLGGIKIPAVDGRTLTREDITRECDVEKVDRIRWWLSDGAIGCALSHKLAYKAFLKTTDSAAFIIEDDVVLPKNIKTILHEVEQKIKPNEIILLYYTSFKPATISTFNKVELPNTAHGLYFPMNIKDPTTAAAYCIGREAAKGILNANTPIEVTADYWSHFYSKGGFDSLRVLYPNPITTKNFKSSINYFKKGGLKDRLSEIVNKYRVPVIYQYFKKRRAKRLKNMLGQFTLVDEKPHATQGNSPINKI